jgi:hypothetical protein
MAFVKSKFTEGAKETRQAARDYWLNSAYLSGSQWIYWDLNSDTPRASDPDDRIRMVVNRMATNHRTLISNLMQREITFEVMPNGADDASQHAARISEELLRALHDDHSWENLREKSMASVLKGGTTAVCVDWDSDLGDTVETVLSIAEFVVEPGSRDPEKARWWIKAQLLPPAEVQQTFGLRDLPEPDSNAGLNPLQNRMSAGGVGQGGENVDQTLVLTYYERPNGSNPGGFQVEVGGVIVQKGKWSFPFTDRLNLVVGTETVQEDKWYGETIYSQARSPQVALNSAWSNLIEHLRDASVARLLVPNSAIGFLDQATDLPGEMLAYPDGIQPPSWLDPAQLPAWLRQLPSDLQREVDDIMGVHDVSRGMAPANLESGTALSILAEKDSSPVGRLIKVTAGMWTRLGRMVLQLQEMMVGDDRFSVIETDAGPLALTWTGKDIAGQTNAKVPLEGIIPISRAAQEQLATKMLEMGVITSIPEWTAVAQVPNGKDMIQRTHPAVAKARRENGRMAQGEILIPATFDPHDVHIPEHNNFRMSVAYEQMTPEWQEACDDHVRAHETVAAEAAGKMELRAAAGPGMAGVPSADGDPHVELPPMDPAMVDPMASNPGSFTPEVDADMMEPTPEDLMAQLEAEL